MKSILLYGQLTKAKKQGVELGSTRLHAASAAIREGYNVREFERVERTNNLTFIRKRRIELTSY